MVWLQAHLTFSTKHLYPEPSTQSLPYYKMATIEAQIAMLAVRRKNQIKRFMPFGRSTRSIWWRSENSLFPNSTPTLCGLSVQLHGSWGRVDKMLLPEITVLLSKVVLWPVEPYGWNYKLYYKLLIPVVRAP
jgi:hypothetical protein